MYKGNKKHFHVIFKIKNFNIIESHIHIYNWQSHYHFLVFSHGLINLSYTKFMLMDFLVNTEYLFIFFEKEAVERSHKKISSSNFILHTQTQKLN